MDFSSISSTDQCVEEFFAHMPEELEAAGSHALSSKSRRPAFWDQHLAESLVLKNVRYLPSLIDAFLEIARDALDSHPNLPAVSQHTLFPDAAKRQLLARQAKLAPIRAEADLTNYYATTTAQSCATVAGTLQYRLPAWECGFMEWTVSPCRRQSSAIADGHLRVIEELPSAEDADSRATLEKMWSEMQAISRWFPDLAIWEFKSLKVVDNRARIFQGIMELTKSNSEFSWEGCPSGERCRYSHQGSSPPITGAPMGYDAPASLLGLDLTTTQNWSSTEMDSQLSLQDNTTVRHLVQQTWAEGVRVDATFVIFHAGNFEIIGFRNRAEQTLYLSDIIFAPKQRQYGQIETGLFIAIFRDATERARMLAHKVPRSWNPSNALKVARPPVNPWPPSRPMSESERIQRSVVGASFNRPILAFQVIPQATQSIPFLTATSYRRQKAYDDLEANVFEFSNMERTMFAVVHATELCIGGDAAICSAQLRVDEQVYNPDLAATKRFSLDFPGRVIIKNASKPATVERLRSEANIYERLEDSPHLNVEGIPELVGFFCTEPEGRTHAQRATLVLSHAGTPVERPHALPDRTKKSYLRILGRIHAAGYLHGKLTASKLLINQGGRVFIVGLGDARPQSSLGSRAILEKLEETQKLQAILGRTVITRTPVRSRVVTFGPFHYEIDPNQPGAIFRAETACLASMDYFPSHQVLSFTLEAQRGKKYIAVEFVTRAEAELFLFQWQTVPIRDHCSALYATLDA
ncbi:hypothetical protein C8R47DRAFT_1328237 [Mycena vitilis]|nr:hypothetical protein C8R47DRAFT_1328237 [Mycena vitilis]